jgi:hypothetical protein
MGNTREAQSQDVREHSFTSGCHPHSAAVVNAPDPPGLQAPGCEARANRAGEMRPSLAPVQAPAADRAPGATQLGDLDAETREASFASFCHTKVSAFFDHRARRDQGISDCHAEPAGEMVVAGTAFAKRSVLRSRRPLFPQRRHREYRQGFKCMRHVRMRER